MMGMSFVDTLKRSLGFEQQKVQRDEAISNFADEILEETYTIYPEQSFYEIILIRPRTISDIDYVYDQLVEENNPVLIDLGFLERRGSIEYHNAARRIKELREQHNVEAILLAKEEGKNLIILTPERVRLVKKQ
jgi:SepF-like predicted cell division protein (DUF552 family)